MFLFHFIFWFFLLLNQSSIEYLFDAEGLKLRKTLKETGKPDFVVDYMGELLYHNGKLVSIDTDEGRATPLDSINAAFTYEFFYNDHLGNLRVAYGVAPNGAYIVQENHYGPTGELLEGINSNSEIYPYLFQGKEHEFAWGLEFDDFHSRMYGAWENRMWQIDGANQFASGYVGMGNNAVNGVDPDGQFVFLLPGVYVGAALISGATNLYSNWHKVKGDWKAGTAYFLSGAVGGVVSLHTVGGGGALTAGLNVGIDIVTGNTPDFKTPTDYAGYAIQEIAIGTVSSVIGAEVGKLVGPSLQNVFKWTQTGFANATKQTITVAGQAYTYFVDAGVKLTKSLFNSVGGMFGRATIGSVERSLLSNGNLLRIENAATRIGKPITVVGSRASGLAKETSDWDYVIENMTNKEWKAVKNSLPGSPSRIDNLPRSIDIFKILDPSKPHITIQGLFIKKNKDSIKC